MILRETWGKKTYLYSYVKVNIHMIRGDAKKFGGVDGDNFLDTVVVIRTSCHSQNVVVCHILFGAECWLVMASMTVWGEMWSVVF
jgi:hypothetical protein